MVSRLYSSIRSPHCLKVAMFLHEKGVPFERIEIDLPANEQRTPAYLRVNPFGLVPAYVDDYGPHPDSLAIMHYLEWRYPQPVLFPPADQLAEALHWINRSSMDYRNVSHHLYWQLIEPPDDGPNAKQVEALMTEGKRLLDELETLLGDRDYLFGDFGVVDIAFIPWVHGYRRFEGLLVSEEFPGVDAWVDRISKRASFQQNHQQIGIPFASTL
jgi:glutathione S-transferase